ncbi:translational GTPase TypA [Candidatus Saccharibacteria bacterium]|nr:translational GTPase TypA [Candidatus Saccharibacteria bacterium]MBQ6414017.1 translational GTPase TypA [Candidatus Saccharibacteria bacterium]
MTLNQDKIRNVAIIAHVDHGKTTLVDGLLKQSHTFRDNQAEMSQTLIMDSMDQEHERGITITAKQTCVYYDGYKINIIDTPGHADFSGEVERTLNMADGVLLIVDAQEGPMPQTKFVLSKALSLGLKPVVVINKIDKPAARIDEVLSEVESLFLELATDESQLFYPVYYAVAREGRAGRTVDLDDDLHVIFEAIINDIPAPSVDADAKSAQLLVAALAGDNYLGKYCIGKIFRGKLKKGQSVKIMHNDEAKNSRIDNLFIYKGLGKEEVFEAIAGDIVAITGVSEANIGDTIATGDNPEALPGIELEAPTLSIYIGPNTSPLKGREGEFTTSRQIAERLERELETNIALKIEPDGLGYKVSGRGELHLSVLIETMRREGYELEAGRPEVVYREIDGTKCEPIEDLTIEVEPEFVGAVSQELGVRKAELKTQEITSSGAMRFVYEISTAALIGLRNNLLTATKGTVVMSSIPSGYRPVEGRYKPERNGALVSFETGVSTAYALDAAQARGVLFIPPQVPVYQGMIVGLSNKKDDLDINICREKQLTNMRTHASDGAIQLTPYTQLSLEQCLDFLLDDELLEVTPKSLRLRKRQLDPIKRKRENKALR